MRPDGTNPSCKDERYEESARKRGRVVPFLLFCAAAAEIRGFYVILQLMGEQTVVVWDLETVPDLAVTAPRSHHGDAPKQRL